MYYSDNPIADFDRYEADRERALSKLPHCCNCGEAIQDEYLYDIDGNLFCEDCLKSNYRKPTENYND
jgi:formylmethanofuran dehydrogenase subunit E